MDGRDWEVIIGRIGSGKCTPFLGAGINRGVLPLGSEIAQEWAHKHNYPLKDCDDLARVSQFMAVAYDDGLFPKDRMLDRLRGVACPDFSSCTDDLAALKALAELPLSIYLTTNYDNLMVKALEHQGKKPTRELCRWNSALKKLPAIDWAEPSVANPLVFHLHGHDEFRHSLVLTEDDYLDFLVNVSRNPKLVPPRIQQAMADSSLLFIGYRLKDINFRVLYRGLVQSLEGSQRSLSVAVQVAPPDDHRGDPQAAQAYLTNYFKDLKVRVYWGTAKEFAEELLRRYRGNAITGSGV